MARKQKYIKIGRKRLIDGEIAYKPEEYNDGIEQGNIYKDEEVYEKDWDAICYISESAFVDAVPKRDGYYANPGGYTHNDLLRLCNGNRELCDYIFHRLIWAYPETYLDEYDDEDLAYFYRFIVEGAKVWREDPAGEASGEYSVFCVPFQFNEYGEIDMHDTFSSDAIIVIGNEVSTIVATPCELTPVYK